MQILYPAICADWIEYDKRVNDPKTNSYDGILEVSIKNIPKNTHFANERLAIKMPIENAKLGNRTVNQYIMPFIEMLKNMEGKELCRWTLNSFDLKKRGNLNYQADKCII